MDGFLARIGLVDYFTLNSKVSKDVFQEGLIDIMDMTLHTHKDEGKRLYDGSIQGDEFSFRKKKGLFGFSRKPETLVKVVGTISEINGELIIRAKVVAQTRELLHLGMAFMPFLFVILIIFSSEVFKVESIILLVVVFIFLVYNQYSTLKKGVVKFSPMAYNLLDRLLK